jgi:hypothetical protein
MKKILFILSIFLIPQITLAERVQRNENQSTLYAAEGDTGPIGSVDRYGNRMCSINAGTASATNPIKLEDLASTSGDAGMFALAVKQNSSPTSFGGTSLDYTPIGVNSFGDVYVDLNINHRESSTSSPLRAEDEAYGAAEPVLMSGNQAVSAVAQTVGTSGDVAPASMDLGNRLITTTAPSGEMLQGCNTAVTTNTTGTIVNAVASKYNFMTGFTCTNTGATATRVIIEDGDGVDMATLFLPATSGYATATFPSPGIRTNAVNRVIQVNVITTGSSTICCLSGFVGAV